MRQLPLDFDMTIGHCVVLIGMVVLVASYVNMLLARRRKRRLEADLKEILERDW